MRSFLRWTLGLGVAAAVVALGVWAFLESRKELARERQLERPVDVPRRLTRLATGERSLEVDGATAERIGLVAKPLECGALAPEEIAHGIVLDPAPLLALLGELTAAELRLAAARAEEARLEQLGGSSPGVSPRVQDAAKLETRTRALEVGAALGRLRNEWGARFAELEPAPREALLDRLARRETALVRVTIPGAAAPSRELAGAAVTVFGDESSRLEAAEILPAPRADETLQGRGLLLRIEAPPLELRPGAAVTGYLRVAGGSSPALLVPRGALVRFEGRAWVYVQVAPESFVRRAVDLDRPTAEGWWIPPGDLAAAPVVLVGAQLLLSEELRARIQVEEEGGE